MWAEPALAVLELVAEAGSVVPAVSAAGEPGAAVSVEPVVSAETAVRVAVVARAVLVPEAEAVALEAAVPAPMAQLG